MLCVAVDGVFDMMRDGCRGNGYNEVAVFLHEQHASTDFSILCFSCQSPHSERCRVGVEICNILGDFLALARLGIVYLVIELDEFSRLESAGMESDAI